jgi:hypothetical protein
MNTHKIIKIGNCSTGNSEGGMVYSPEGISQTITAGTHGYGMGNIIINDRGFTNKSPQISYGICPTLRAESHGNLPKVIINENNS